MAEEQQGKTARVLGGITEQPTPPTPKPPQPLDSKLHEIINFLTPPTLQPAQPLDSRLHEIINFLSVYLRIIRFYFPFIKSSLADAKSGIQTQVCLMIKYLFIPRVF